MTSITPIQCNRPVASPDAEATPASDTAAEGGKFGGIDGESTERSHGDWVEAAAFRDAHVLVHESTHQSHEDSVEVLRAASTNPSSVLPGAAMAPSGTDAVSSFVATHGLHAAASTHDSAARHFADLTVTKKLDSNSSRLGD